MAEFTLIDPPLLSRSTIDRADHLRDDGDRLAAGWSTARVLTVDARGRYAVADGALKWLAASDIADTPPAEAVLLGIEDDVDLWALRVDEIDGEKDDPRRGAQALSGDEAGLLVTALGILNWHAAAGFSPVDGSATTHARAGWVRRNADGKEEFPRTDPAIITVVHDGGDRVLLGRQAGWPDRWYSTLAGFVEPGESLEQCVIREVHEEVGLDVWSPRYLGSQPWPFPRSLMLGFEVTADPAQPLNFLDGEIGDAQWFDRAEVVAALESGEEWIRGDGTPNLDDTARLRIPGSVSIAHALIKSWALSP